MEAVDSVDLPIMAVRPESVEDTVLNMLNTWKVYGVKNGKDLIFAYYTRSYLALHGLTLIFCVLTFIVFEELNH